MIETDGSLPSLCYWRYEPESRKGFSLHISDGTYRVGTYFSQVQQLQLPPLEPSVLYDPKQPAPAIAFDTQQELLWVGNEAVS